MADGVQRADGKGKVTSIVSRVANFQKMKFGTRRQRRRDRDAVGVEGDGEYGGVSPSPAD